MSDIRPVKIIRIGSSLALVLPVGVCRDLKINRGDFLNLRVADGNTIFISKIKVVNAEDTGELKDNSLPTIKNG